MGKFMEKRSAVTFNYSCTHKDFCKRFSKFYKFGVWSVKIELATAILRCVNIISCLSLLCFILNVERKQAKGCSVVYVKRFQVKDFVFSFGQNELKPTPAFAELVLYFQGGESEEEARRGQQWHKEAREAQKGPACAGVICHPGRVSSTRTCSAGDI